MHKGNLSRRGFMQRSLAALTFGAGLPAWFARAGLRLRRRQEGAGPARRKAPDGRHRHRQPADQPPGAIYDAAKGHKGVEYVAACDVDKRHLQSAASSMMKKDGFDAKGYKDFRELLDNPDINAVTIAVPDHWHALIAIEAMRKAARTSTARSR